ncbi:hypothetical protein ABZ712_20170 [Streptomyces sp. NPDC006906]|uniref:hypothetical protein n=1 Tax=Streptomyces sp. NPDC006906 TaxID=3154782 RepID=UPI0033E413AC
MEQHISAPSTGVILRPGNVVGAIPAAMAAVLPETVFPYLDRLAADLALPVFLGLCPINLAPLRLREIVRGDLTADRTIEGETTSLGGNGQTATLAGVRFRAHLRLREIPARLTALRLASRLVSWLVKEVPAVLALKSYRYRS